jgi:hypothetical protein
MNRANAGDPERVALQSQERWKAVLARDGSANGSFVYAVSSRASTASLVREPTSAPRSRRLLRHDQRGIACRIPGVQTLPAE